MAQSGLRRTYNPEMILAASSDVDTFEGDEEEEEGTVSREHLIMMAEKIQAELLMASERLLSLIDTVDGRKEPSRDDLSYYQEHIWPLLLEADDAMQLLISSVREGIDACRISEERLNFLLEVNKFYVDIQKIATFLSQEVNDEIEQLLELRERGIRGITLKSSTLSDLQQYYSTLRMKLLKA